MNRIPLSEALEIINSGHWNGKTIFAAINTSEVTIYRGIDPKTLQDTGGICFDCVLYTENEFNACKATLEKAGTRIIAANAVKDSNGKAIFWNINAKS